MHDIHTSSKAVRRTSPAMAGLGPAIHALRAEARCAGPSRRIPRWAVAPGPAKAWMAGPGPAMTAQSPLAQIPERHRVAQALDLRDRVLPVAAGGAGEEVGRARGERQREALPGRPRLQGGLAAQAEDARRRGARCRPPRRRPSGPCASRCRRRGRIRSGAPAAAPPAQARRRRRRARAGTGGARVGFRNLSRRERSRRRESAVRVRGYAAAGGACGAFCPAAGSLSPLGLRPSRPSPARGEGITRPCAGTSAPRRE